MIRPFVDLSIYQSRKMSRDGNIDAGYWFGKTNDEKMAAATRMNEVAFSELQFVKKKCDRTILSVRKHPL
jgi:hypothetical protein